MEEANFHSRTAGRDAHLSRVDCDADYDEPAKRWFDGVLAQLAWEPRAVIPAPEAEGESSWSS